MTIERTVRAQQGDTVDAICWRYYKATAGITEAVYNANPGLADCGPVLPHGQPVKLPRIDEAKSARTELALWD